MIATLCLLPLTALQSGQHDIILEDDPDSSKAGRNCNPSFELALESLSYAPNEPIPLEVYLSCMDYDSTLDNNGNGIMDFKLEVRLLEDKLVDDVMIWSGIQDSEYGVGPSSVLWDFNDFSSEFTEVFYLNGTMNNQAENDNELWPQEINNLKPHTNYIADVRLTNYNSSFFVQKDIAFSVIPESNSTSCSPLLKAYATNSSLANESELATVYSFHYFEDIVYSHLSLTCMNPSETYSITWRITHYISGDEVDIGWWNVTGVISANTTISHSVESIHVFDGLIIYSISGSVSSSANETIEYYPSFDRGYSYDSFRINVSDLDDDGIEDLIDNCQSEPNPEQLDFDSNGVGDVCDTDIDGDNLSNSIPPNQIDDDDKCPYEFASTSQDSDGDGCIDPTDQDGDGILDANDNCILVPNPNQANLDDDAQGDACDGDIDGDNVTNVAPIHYTNGTSQDLCPYVDATGNDKNQDGCIDEGEPCKKCEYNSTSGLSTEDVETVVVVGGAGIILGLVLAYGAMKALNLVRFERTSSNDLVHMPKRKTADLYSDHYSQRGIVRQQEMTLSARMDLDDYVTEENEGDGTNE